MTQRAAASAMIIFTLVLSCASTARRVPWEGAAGAADEVVYTVAGVRVWSSSEPATSEHTRNARATRDMYRRISGGAWIVFILAVVFGCLTAAWKTWGMVAVGCAGSGLVLSTMAAVGHWLEYALMAALAVAGLWLIWVERGFSVTQLYGGWRNDE